MNPFERHDMNEGGRDTAMKLHLVSEVRLEDSYLECPCSLDFKMNFQVIGSHEES